MEEQNQHNENKPKLITRLKFYSEGRVAEMETPEVVWNTQLHMKVGQYFQFKGVYYRITAMIICCMADENPITHAADSPQEGLIQHSPINKLLMTITLMSGS